MINPVNQTDFPAAIAALGDQPSLGHVTTMLAVAGMLLQAYGLFALFRLGNGQRCLAGTALRTGVIASLFGWAIFVLAMGRRLPGTLRLSNGAPLWNNAGRCGHAEVGA